jgi:hypothetical protein
MPNETEIRPFRVEIPAEAIADLRRRIAAVRWPSKELVADRSQGVQLATLQELARYWAADYAPVTPHAYMLKVTNPSFYVISLGSWRSRSNDLITAQRGGRNVGTTCHGGEHDRRRAPWVS